MEAYAKSRGCIKVDLIDDNGNIIKTYNSAHQAEVDLKLTRGKVSEVCNHKYGRKTVGGYRFQWNYPLKRKLYENPKS